MRSRTGGRDRRPASRARPGPPRARPLRPGRRRTRARPPGSPPTSSGAQLDDRAPGPREVEAGRPVDRVPGELERADAAHPKRAQTGVGPGHQVPDVGLGHQAEGVYHALALRTFPPCVHDARLDSVHHRSLQLLQVLGGSDRRAVPPGRIEHHGRRRRRSRGRAASTRARLPSRAPRGRGAPSAPRSRAPRRSRPQLHGRGVRAARDRALPPASVSPMRQDGGISTSRPSCLAKSHTSMEGGVIPSVVSAVQIWLRWSVP